MQVVVKNFFFSMPTNSAADDHLRLVIAEHNNAIANGVIDHSAAHIGSLFDHDDEEHEVTEVLESQVDAMQLGEEGDAMDYASDACINKMLR